MIRDEQLIGEGYACYECYLPTMICQDRCEWKDVLMEFAFIIYGLVENGRLSGAAKEMVQKAIYTAGKMTSKTASNAAANKIDDGKDRKGGKISGRQLAEAVCVGVIWNNTEGISAVNWLDKFDMDEYIRMNRVRV